MVAADKIGMDLRSYFYKFMWGKGVVTLVLLSLLFLSSLLFSGIANPLSFERTVAGLGAKIVDHLQFSDHYNYKGKDIEKITQKAELTNSPLILTTEKDYVRIIPLIRNISQFYYLTIDIQIVNGFDILKNKLTSFI